MKKFLTSLFLLGALNAPNVVADSVSGKITFDKKAPFVGLLYAVETGFKPGDAMVDQKNKVFDKKIVVVSSGSKVTFNNSDTFDHNIFANDSKTGVTFDAGLMSPGQTTDLDVNWDEKTMTRVGCKIHPRMRTYIANIPSATFQSFEFEKKVTDYEVALDVTDSHKQFVFAIPGYDSIAINLAAGESASFDITKKGKKKGTLALSRN